MKDALRLNANELASHAWEKVDKHIEERLVMHRRIVENPQEPEAKRLGAAHCINELKELLKLAQPASQQAPESYAD